LKQKAVVDEPMDEVQLFDDDVPPQRFEFVDGDDEGSLQSPPRTASWRVAQRVRVLDKRGRVLTRDRNQLSHVIGADHRSCHVHSQLRLVAHADDELASGHACQGVQGSELTPASVFRVALFSQLGAAATTADETDPKLQLFSNVGKAALGDSRSTFSPKAIVPH
jgi:hypothetical protein